MDYRAGEPFDVNETTRIQGCSSYRVEVSVDIKIPRAMVFLSKIEGYMVMMSSLSHHAPNSMDE